MKKILCLVTVLFCVVLFSACTQNAGVNTNVPDLSADKDSHDIQGITNGNSYENAHVGIGFTIPDGWSFYSDSEIASSLNTPTEFSKDETMVNPEIANYFCDTAAFSEDFKSAVIVTIEEKRESTLGLASETLIDNTISLTKKDGEQIYDEFEIEKKQFDVSGKALWGYDAKTKYDNASVYQRCVLTDNEKYITTLTFTSETEEGLNELTEKLYIIK